MELEHKEVKEPKPALLHQISDVRFKPDAEDKVDIIFDGTTTLWRSGVRLDVLVVMHTKFECVEVIGYNPAVNMEAPRMYLDGPTLFQRQNLQEFEAKVREKKEFFLRRRRTFVIEEIERDIFYTFVSNYVLTRLSVDNPNGIFFNLILQPKFGDKLLQPDKPVDWKERISLTEDCPDFYLDTIPGSLEDGTRLDVIIGPPIDLAPARTHHFSKFRASLFLSGLNEVQEHTEFCAKNRSKAESLVSVAAVAFMQTAAMFSARCHLNMSKSRLRWARAINRVLNQNLCAKLRRRLSMSDVPTTSTAPPAIALLVLPHSLSVDTQLSEGEYTPRRGSILKPTNGDSSTNTGSKSPRKVVKLAPLERIPTCETALVSARSRPLTARDKNCETPRTARTPLWQPKYSGNEASMSSPRRTPSSSTMKRTNTQRMINGVCVSDEEYNLLMKGLTGLEVDANLPSYMKPTLSHLLMTNDVPMSPTRPTTANVVPMSPTKTIPLAEKVIPLAIASPVKSSKEIITTNEITILN